MVSRISILLACLAGAAFSAELFVDLDQEFHTRVIANGATCASCHSPQTGHHEPVRENLVAFLQER